MSQRGSGYSRQANDCYETPAWVTQVLLPHLPPRLRIWEPACGSGKMVLALTDAGHTVEASDIAQGVDFLMATDAMGCSAVVTNPPYGLAAEFIDRALLLAPLVAMLLRTDFDHARSRRHLFGGCPHFAKKLVLTKRIVWFEDREKVAAPSFNHAWFVWDRAHSGPPTLAYSTST
jgi:hypothetical protein